MAGPTTSKPKGPGIGSQLLGGIMDSNPFGMAAGIGGQLLSEALFGGRRRREEEAAALRDAVNAYSLGSAREGQDSTDNIMSALQARAAAQGIRGPRLSQTMGETSPYGGNQEVDLSRTFNPVAAGGTLDKLLSSMEDPATAGLAFKNGRYGFDPIAVNGLPDLAVSKDLSKPGRKENQFTFGGQSGTFSGGVPGLGAHPFMGQGGKRSDSERDILETLKG